MMKYIHFLLVAVVLNGCKTPYSITTQEELTGSPCQTSSTGVNLRIKNVAKIAFSKIAVKYKDKDLLFAGLKPGDSTCYKNLPSLWANMSVDVFFSKDPGYSMTLRGMAIDHVGEKIITHGYATVNVKITRIKGQLTYDEYMTIDKSN